MLIRDLIILGRAVPVLLKDQRKTICTAGYSDELGFVRVYPTYHFDDIHIWDKVSIEVKKVSSDTRNESWKKLAQAQFKKISTIKNNKKAKETLLESICQDCCTHDLNEERRSLAVIKPQIEDCYFKEITTTEEGKLITMSLMDFFTTQKTPKRKSLQVKKNFNVIPYIKYRCGDNCKTKKAHNQQVLEWGGYQWIQKQPDNMNQLWENFRIFDEEWYKYFFIGNLHDQRTSWLIISILRGKKSENIKKVDGKILYQSEKNKKPKQTKLL